MNRLFKRASYKCKSTLIILLSAYLNLIGQQNPDNLFLSSGFEIVVDVLPGNDIFYSHPYNKGISIYNLAEVFQIKAEKIFSFNNLNSTKPINDGRIVNIPLQKDLIINEKSRLSKLHKYLPLFYRVKKGETVYRICKQYFGIENTTLMNINHKKSDDVKVGEALLIGWWLVPDKKLTKNLTIRDNLKPVIEPIDKKPEIQKENLSESEHQAAHVPIIKYYLSDVVGWWDKSLGGSKSYFVLHNEARPGSLIDIYNPMLRNHIKAKVIGKIPSDTYSEDIEIIISPAIAKDLGILDTRYMVNVKYEKLESKDR